MFTILFSIMPYSNVSNPKLIICVTFPLYVFIFVLNFTNNQRNLRLGFHCTAVHCTLYSSLPYCWSVQLHAIYYLMSYDPHLCKWSNVAMLQNTLHTIPHRSRDLWKWRDYMPLNTRNQLASDKCNIPELNVLRKSSEVFQCARSLICFCFQN